MSVFKFNCPHCAQALDVEDDVEAVTFECPVCAGRIHIASTDSATGEQQEEWGAPQLPPRRKRLSVPPSQTEMLPPLPTEDASSTIPCPTCGLRLHYGLRRCRYCGTALSADRTKDLRPSGIGRLLFFPTAVAVGIMQAIGTPMALAIGDWIIHIGFHTSALVLTAVLVGFRMKNIGFSPWRTLWLVVPIANLYVLFQCAVYPPGYRHKGTLDRTGKIMIVLSCLALPVLLLVGIAAWRVRSPAGSSRGEMGHTEAPSMEPLALPPLAYTAEGIGTNRAVWVTEIEKSILESSGWWGSLGSKDVRVCVASLSDASPAHAFWVWTCRRAVSVAIVLVRVAPKGTRVTVDLTDAKVRFANGALKRFLSVSTLLEAASEDGQKLLRTYAQPGIVEPGGAPYIAPLFVPRGFDWEVVRSVRIQLDGKETDIPGAMRTREEKHRLFSFDRGLQEMLEET